MWIADYIGTYIIIAPFIILAAIGYYRLFQKAGQPGWAAFVPFYATWVMLKICGRPTWWLIWVFIPLANVVFTVGIFIDFIRSYGKFSIREQLAGYILSFIYLPKWGFDNKTVYIGPSTTDEFNQQHRVYGRSPVYTRWAMALLVLLGLALFIRAFVGTTYSIPTSSMEGTLLTGDNIWVSKLNYGARLPITPVANPYSGAHIGRTRLKTYWDGIQLPYLRLPGFGRVKRNDVIVFNYPMDTLDHPPVSQKETYIKRCEGLPGDTLYAEADRQFANGKRIPDPPAKQMDYHIITKGYAVNPEVYKKLHVSFYYDDSTATMTDESARVLRHYPNVKSVTPLLAQKGVSDTNNFVFPYNFKDDALLNEKISNYNWNVDNYGPLIVPKKGWTVKLDSTNFALYEYAIRVYEKNTVKVSGNDIYINGAKANTYTFKMDYYWVIGDNRHDSEDSRYWGFVPEDHVVGKVVLVYMSYDASASLFKQIRWDRIFTFIH